MHQMEREGNKRAATVNRLISDRERLIGAILLGNNLVNILASALATTLFASLMPGATGVAVATAVMTILVLVFAEVLPKTYAITRADRMAMSVSKPISWLNNTPLVLLLEMILGRSLSKSICCSASW